MIRLVRSDEPAVLRDKRPTKLTEVQSRRAAGLATKLTGYGDDGVKDELFKDQHSKCAYCEKRDEQAKWRDAEHYRPKSVYWWLTWTWENLLFSCVDCNREYKRDQFPLVDLGSRLALEAAPPGDELPLLLDPYAEDAPGQEFRALSRSAVDALVSRDLRDRYRLPLWKPAVRRRSGDDTWTSIG